MIKEKKSLTPEYLSHNSTTSCHTHLGNETPLMLQQLGSL